DIVDRFIAQHITAFDITHVMAAAALEQIDIAVGIGDEQKTKCGIPIQPVDAHIAQCIYLGITFHPAMSAIIFEDTCGRSAIDIAFIGRYTYALGVTEMITPLADRDLRTCLVQADDRKKDRKKGSDRDHRYKLPHQRTTGPIGMRPRY